jgi:hypothetical protein
MAHALERALAPNGDEAVAASAAVDLCRLLVEDVETLLDERQRAGQRENPAGAGLSVRARQDSNLQPAD